MSEPMTEPEQAVMTVLVGPPDGCEYDPELVRQVQATAQRVVAAVRPILAAEFRKAAGDTLADLAPQQATPDARDAFWRAAVVTRSKASTAAALRTTTPEGN
jgi:hypothetical protein